VCRDGIDHENGLAQERFALSAVEEIFMLAHRREATPMRPAELWSRFHDEER
jgi:hypothetical protein